MFLANVLQSVHSGRGSKGVVGGGVMEDGTSHAHVAARVVSASSAAHRKAQSLPGHYSRPQHLQHAPPPQSFRDAFTTSKSPTPPAVSPGTARHNATQGLAPAAPPRGPTSPRATRVASTSSLGSQQYQHQQQQRQHLQQRLLQQEQNMQQAQQQKLQQQQQQRLEQQHLQQRLEQQHLQQKMQGQHEQRQKESEPAERQAPVQEKKSKRSLLSGIFRRRKKGMADSSSSSSSSSSDSEEPQKRHFLRRKSKKKEPKEREPLPPPPPPPPAPEDYSPVARSAGSVRVTPLDGSGGSSSLGCESSFMSTDGRKIVRVTPAGVMSTSRGMDIQPLGIPVSLAQQGRRGVSASHDSLPVSLGSWAGGGSHASLGYCSGGGMGARSSSTDTISKKERREALKARVERLRDKFKDSSSDEEKASVSSHSMYGSESSLSKSNSLSKRSRAARTERFLRRKSQELETLRTETEKDRRNREVVQARIQEIQRVREYEAERNRINEEKKKEAEKAHKPRWSAKLVYQESSEYESSVVLRTPSVSPAASPHMKAKFQGHIPRQPSETREAVVMRNKPHSVAVSLAPPSGPHLRRSFQDYETPLQGDLRSHRSASYDSNINRSSFIMQSPGMSPVSGIRSGLTPPVPPPRDPSRIMSPADGRPMSFSFESLNQDPNRPNSSQSSLSNFTKGSSPSPSVRSVPAYLGPKPNGPQVGPPPLVTAPTRRSFSELQLSPQQQTQLKYNTGGAPARPSPPGYPNTQYRYTDQPPRPTPQNQYYRAQQQQQQYAQPLQLQQHTQSQPQVVQSQQNNQLKYYTDQSPQYAKIVPISSVPPSPSSDYSSYMSDNSARLQQVNTAWRQKEQEIKNKRNLPSQVLSDSSRSNSPKGIDGNNSNNSISLGVDQQAEETYGSILPKKARPPPITLKQAESLSSLSGQSDVSSPVPKGPDSDSSQGSLARDKKTVAQNRPLSMVLEKSESAEKDSPPVTPKTQPQPPRRGHRQLAASDLSATKQQILHNIIKHKREHPQDKPKYQKEFEEMYRKEKERLEKSKCSNFEEALKELEEIYDSLKLDSDDILDRAERRDLPTVHQQLRSNKDGQDTLNDSTSEATETDSTVKDRSSRPRTPRMRRAGVPDKKSDDMHFRRCQQSSRNQPDVQKALQMTGSYLLVSPAHTTPSDVDKNVPKDPMLEGEPDIVYDDVSYRNIKQANAIKIIDPQPPFGIPLGPTTQSSPSDYLHVSRKDNYRPKMIARKQPDTTMDDLAFRNLRKEQRDRELNTSELDELLSEANTDSPVHRRRAMRSMSADRARAMQNEHNLQHAHEVLGASASKDRGGKLQTPRRVKHQQEARRAGRFFESYKDAIGDSESGLTSPRHNPSWLERANLTDNKWENLSTSNLSNLSTSTETLTEMSSARAVSQPDIRQAIIREARVPPGGPSTWLEAKRKCAEASLTSDTPTITTITAPKLVKIQTIQSSPVSPVVVERKPYRPLDSIFNNKPKPFYLADPKPTEQQQKQDHVDIAHLDALISTLSKIETNEETTTPSTPPATSPLTEKNVDNVKPDVVCDSDIYAKPDTISKPDTSTPLKISEEPVYENVFEPQQSVSESTEPVEKICAKANIEKAIRLSMALESSNSEGERDDEVELTKRHHADNGGSLVTETRKSDQGKQKERRKSEGEKHKEKEKRRDGERAKGASHGSDKLKEREKKDKKLEYERLRIGEREKRRSEREKEKRKSLERERRAPNEEEKRERKKSGEERDRRKSTEREKRRSEEKERRRSEERERRRSEERVKRKSPEKAKREGERRERSLDKEYARLSLSPEKRLSSSSGSGRMVQQSGTSGGGGGGAGSRGEQDDPERAELERRERIQRYKDERRKQIAARYGTAEWSSSEESGTGEESSYRAYRRRRRAGRDNNDSSTNDLSSQDAKRPHENGSSLEGRGGRRGVLGSSSEDVVAAGASVRTTRASRLRQAALTSPNANNNNNNNTNSNNNNNNSSGNNNSFNSNNNNNANPAQELKDTEGVGERGRGEAPPDLPPPKRPPDQGDARAGVGMGGDSADSTLSGSDGRSGRARRAGGEERDKSHKRKSNLNRSTTEEATADPFPLSHPSDSNEDTPRRRRRRTPLSPVGGGLPSVAAAEPLKTPEVVRHVVSRLTPPPSPPASSQPHSSPSSQPSPPAARRQPSPQPLQVPPPNTFQPIQPAQPALGSPQGTQSAPSTLDSRHNRHAHQQVLFGASVTGDVSSARRVSASSENEEGLSTRKVPPKLAPLRKPDIPDVLRPKDNTSLASPGVVSTPPTSRPSSVVLDKPPLAPEGLRPAALRSSLRKPSDTGTCFLASRREKRDEATNGAATGPKSDLFREQQKPKKGDRLSKSDMNLKIDSNSGGRASDISTPTGTSDAEGGEASSPPLASPSLPNAEVMSSRLEALTARARDAMDRADRLSEDAAVTPESADTMVHECEQYLTTVTSSGKRESPGTSRRRDLGAAGMEAASERAQPSPAAVTGVLSDTGQKNWVGGSEGRGKESKRMANEKEVKKKETKRESQAASGVERIPGAPAGPSGPPDYVAFMDESVSPPPEEVVLGLQHRQLEDEEDEGSDTSPLRSPEHRGSGRCRPRRCSLDGDSPRTNSPDPQSILKRRSSREDVMPDRPTTPEPHGILKRKTSSRTSSLDAQEGEPRPILKKKSSAEELEHFEPRPILKKKSSTDDELDDRPRSILKGGRSREDLDRSEGVISPNPILKRSPRYDSEGEGELRPILKRRDTTDGVRLRLHVSDGEDVEGDLPSVRVRSDSAPESAIRMRGRSPPAPSATPAHGILKKRGAHSPARFDQMDSELGAILRSRRSLGPGDAEAESPNSTPMRPVSPSLVALTKREDATVTRSGERPLSVAERVAGMEAARQEPVRPPAPRSPTPTRSPGARPKVTAAFLNNIKTPETERESRRNGAYSLVAEPASTEESAEAINEAFLDRPVVEAFNSAMTSSLDSTPDTPSSVSQRAAFFAQLEREQKKPGDTSSGSTRSTRFGSRRERGTRHATQPVTEDEVSQAARMADASDSASASHDSDCTPARRESLPWMGGTTGGSSSSQDEKHKTWDSNSVGARVALWTRMLEEERRPAALPTDSVQGSRRRSRSTRFRTQPVTMEEVAHAHALNNQQAVTPPTAGTPTEEQDLASGFRAAREAVLRNAGEVLQGLTPGSSPRRRAGSRKTSFNEPEEDNSSDGVRGILKRESSGGSRDGQRDSPRSILKHHHSSSSADSRRASFSESESHPRGILKAESPLPPPVGSPEHEAKLLRGVLKKDSSLEDSKEIKSILKPESESLDPDHSSDSSSDDVTLTTANTPQGQECDLAEAIREIDPIRHKEEQHKSDSFKSEHHRVDLAEALRQVEPIKAKDDLAEALRQIEPIRAKDRSRERDDRAKEDAQTTVTKELNSSKKLTSSMMTTTMVATSSVGSPSSSSSSNSENELKVIKNEAVMRRRTAHSRRYDERRSMVELRSLEKDKLSPEDSSAAAPSPVSPSKRHQHLTPQDGGGSDSSTSSSSSSDSCDGVLKTPAKSTMDASTILSQSPIFRNKTTSLTSSSSTSSSSSSPSPSDGAAKAPPGGATSPGSSINDRLAALQKNGEEGWKSRLKNDGKDVNSNVTLRPKPAGGLRERPVSLMERMSALENSSQQWRGRVTQSDATKFTVAHKMASASTSCVPSVVSGVTPVLTVTPDQPTTPIGSPTVERKKRSPSQKVFKSKTGGNIPSLLGKSSPLSARKDFRRSISTPNDRDKKAEAVEGPSVAVPRADDEDFMAFFSKTSASETVQSPEDGVPSLGDADFDLISETASQLVVKRRSVRVTRRQATSRNPLKALAAREDIKSEYTEVKLGIGEKELKRMKVEELSKGSPLAVEALAGLASKENFSAVALKKVENNPVVREMAPYTSLMLLQVKGRRHAQTRLVKPAVSSVNQGDDFILITPTDVFHYKGEFANVIERAKASEIAQYIVQKKDMGIGSALRNVIELDENSPSGRKAKFWRLLGGDETSSGQLCGMPDEDELIEASLVAANKVYEVQEDSLVPIADSWGQMPKIEILQSDKVLVFDFGPELYIWAGKRACGDERKVGLALGRELWEEEYDYSECDINPITPMVPLSQAALKGIRPEWGLCAKLTENVETIVFKEKFIDWPDLAQQSRIKEVKKDMDRHVAPVCELQPCDARVMLEELPVEPDLVLEMSHLGRGVEYYDEEERRLLNISTNDYKIWHVSEYGKVLMDEKARSHLHEGDTYVVRWYYLITATGRTLKGEPSKHNVTGRSRVAYFFWQGKDSSVSDKGVSALMTVELDEERGPHVRVSMNSEPPAFLNLFQGGLIIHRGRRDEEQNNQNWKLFMVRGELENEGHLVEVEVNSSFLRSRGCVVLLNTKTGIIHLWHGAKALRHTRKVGNITAQKVIETSDSEMGWTPGITKKIKEQFEGAESRDFWEGFGGSSAKNKHFSLLEDEHSYDWTPRVWHMVATHDSFQANEVICSYRATSVPNPLPVLQSDLYSVAQPALFVVDGGHRVWVWQGWWPDESVEGQDSNTTGSAVLRFNFARRAALETTLNYCKLKAKAQAKALAAKSYKKIEVEVDVVEPQLVVAGMEPLEFTNIFPTWTPRPDVTAIQEKEGRWNDGGQHSVSDLLAQLSRTNYSLAELTTKPLPDGADPLHLEVYLSNEEFAEALGMSRDEFYSLQSWKQTELKKKANLF